MSGCGTCSLCCKVLGIAELDKPVNQWCPHCPTRKGCGIYEERPPSCREFECLYLQLFGTSRKLGPEYRPDKSKVVLSMSTDGKVVVAHVDPGFPTAWKKEPMYSLLKEIAVRGVRVLISHSMGTKKIMLAKLTSDSVGVKTVHLTEPDENGIQTYLPGE